MPFLHSFAAFLAIAFSLAADDKWTQLVFDGVDPNRISFTEAGIEIEVKESASPIVHLFSEPRRLSSISAKGSIAGELRFDTGAEFVTAPDDALLRIGIIESGENRLSPLQQLTAPAWIRHLESLLPSSASGIGSIHSFLLLPSPEWIGEARTNPNAPLFLESVVASPDSENRFSLSGELEEPIEAVGIWIMADGDDSGSTFITRIEEFELRSHPDQDSD